jgi:hypothetical protein
MCGEELKAILIWNFGKIGFGDLNAQRREIKNYGGEVPLKLFRVYA